MSLFEDITNYCAPHQSQAQVVLGLDEAGLDLARVLQILNVWEERSALVNEGNRPEAVLVVRTGVKSCQEAVIQLTENGFNRLQAVYPPEGKRNAAPKPQAINPSDH